MYDSLTSVGVLVALLEKFSVMQDTTGTDPGVTFIAFRHFTGRNACERDVACQSRR